MHSAGLRRLNKRERSRTFGGRHAAATDGDEVCAETRVNPSGGTPLDVFNYTYNADGELTAVSDDNSAYQYTYNADGEETSQGDVGSPDLPTVTLTYDYDADGNRTSMDDSLGGLVSYTYDARDELTNETLSGSGISAMAVANTYDNAGNMTGEIFDSFKINPSKNTFNHGRHRTHGKGNTEKIKFGSTSPNAELSLISDSLFPSSHFSVWSVPSVVQNLRLLRDNPAAAAYGRARFRHRRDAARDLMRTAGLCLSMPRGQSGPAADRRDGSC